LQQTTYQIKHKNYVIHKIDSLKNKWQCPFLSFILNKTESEDQMEKPEEQKKENVKNPNSDVPNHDFKPDEASGSDEDSYKAATRGTEIETHEPHPTDVPHPREQTGRHVDNSENRKQ
jgi:hypothetical protein